MAIVIGLGEGMVRLSPPDHQRLEQASYLEVQIGGAELNVAVALAQLGVDAAWISKLVDSPVGRLITNRARRYGVDVSRVVWTRDGRVGLYFLEVGAAPRPNLVIYDRKQSAINYLTADELDWGFIGNARVLHLTGITPGLSENARRLIRDVVQRSRELGVSISFDVNYRSKLWSPEEAREELLRLLPQVDILFATRDDVETVLGITGDAEEVVRTLHREFASIAAFLTMGAEGAMVCADDDEVHYQPPFTIVEVDRLGAGDAFAAGALLGWLEGVSWQRALAYAVAMAAFKYSIPGDFAIIERDELDALLSQGIQTVQR